MFPCGSENASEIHQSLRHSVHVELFGASSVEDHGRLRFERYFGGLPRIGEAGFDTAFSGLTGRLGIDVVFATHDSVQAYLAPRATSMGFFLVNGDPDTAAIVRRKSATYATFSDRAWVPRVYRTLDEIAQWPIIVKPDRGQGGQSVSLARTRLEAASLAESMEDPLLCEFLPGKEMTVDCFSDAHRRLLWVGPRTRDRVRAGISMRSTFADVTPEVQEIVGTVNDRLTLRGPWFAQVKLDRDGRWKLLEVSSRIGGAMVAQRARGINLPLMAIQDYMGRELVALVNPQVKLVERNIATRATLEFEYDTVFVDLDDTLVRRGVANPPVLAFLYQELAEGKRLKLITRHEGNVRETLRAARIATELFDEIVCLSSREAKADYVTSRSIFVDNHFPERLDVARRRGIPVLDVDALEFLVR